MNECRTSPVASSTKDQLGPIVINFPRDNFLLIQIGIGALFSVYAFKEYVDGTIGILSTPILMGGAILFARAKFKTRPPKWALVDPVNKILRLKQRWPKCSEIEIDISKLQSVEAYVPRFQRFPVTLLNLYFEGTSKPAKPSLVGTLLNLHAEEIDKATIIFDVESSETRFFATPNEVVPPSVEELVSVLQTFIIEKKENR